MSISQKIQEAWSEKIEQVWRRIHDSDRIDYIENAHDYLGHDPELTEMYDIALGLAGKGFHDSALKTSFVLEERLREKTSETHNIVVLNLIGTIFANKKEYGQALSKFDEALQYLPKNASNYIISFLYAQKGNMQAGVGDLADSESSLDTALKYDSGLIYAWKRMADLKSMQGKHHKAIPLYKKAIKLYKPANPVREYFFAVLGLVRSYTETGQEKKAENTLKKLEEPPLSNLASNVYVLIKSSK